MATWRAITLIYSEQQIIMYAFSAMCCACIMVSQALGFKAVEVRSIKTAEVFISIFKFKPSDYSNLKRNIGFTTFGLPQQEQNEMLNSNAGNTEEQLRHLSSDFDVIKTHKSAGYLGVIYFGFWESRRLSHKDSCDTSS